MTKKPKMLNAVQKPKLFSTEKRIARNKRAVARKTKKKDLTTSKRMELVNMLKKELGKDGYNQIRKDASKVKLTRSQKSAISKINNYYDYEQGKEKSIAKRKKRITKLSNKPKMSMKKPMLTKKKIKVNKKTGEVKVGKQTVKDLKKMKPKMAMKKPKLNAGFDKLPKEVQQKITKNKKPKMAAKKPKLTGVVKPRLTAKKRARKSKKK